MTDKTQTPAKWRTWVLIASLALNLAFIGLIAGVSLRDKPEPRNRAPAPDLLRELVRAVPSDHKDALRGDLASKRDEMREIRGEMRETRTRLVQVLDSSDFDISQVVAVFDDHRVILSRITRGGHEIILRRIEDMDAEDRQSFARNIRASNEKRSNRK